MARRSSEGKVSRGEGRAGRADASLSQLTVCRTINVEQDCLGPAESPHPLRIPIVQVVDGAAGECEGVHPHRLHVDVIPPLSGPVTNAAASYFVRSGRRVDGP